MQVTKDYVAAAGYNTQRALAAMPDIASAAVGQLPATSEAVMRYVEQLLTPDEEQLCDMATD